jgi:hypothetical protein
MLMRSDRILVSHVGSLPRSATLSDLLISQEAGEPIDAAGWAREVEIATAHVIGKQVEAGVDVGNDGEQSRRRISDLCSPVSLRFRHIHRLRVHDRRDRLGEARRCRRGGAHRIEPVVGSGQRVTPPEALRQRFAVIGRDSIPLRQRSVRRTLVRTRGRGPRAPYGR